MEHTEQQKSSGPSMALFSILSIGLCMAFAFYVLAPSDKKPNKKVNVAQAKVENLVNHTKAQQPSSTKTSFVQQAASTVEEEPSTQNVVTKVQNPNDNLPQNQPKSHDNPPPQQTARLEKYPKWEPIAFLFTITGIAVVLDLYC